MKQEKYSINLHHWWLAIRPKTLPAAACPVIVGTACAVSDGVFSGLLFAAALLNTLLIQISANLANDYFDFIHGIDTPDRKGPKRMAQSATIPPKIIRNAFILTLLLALGLGAFLVIKGGIVILCIGIASVFGVICYSAGPFPIASNALGELFVFIFFGPTAVLGTYYLMAKNISLNAFIASLPVGFLVTAILVVNNLRDIHTDAKAGKKTLAFILGETWTKAGFIMLILFSFTMPCLMLTTSSHWSWTILLPLPLLWKAYPLFKTILKQEGEILNQALADTAKLALAFSILFSIGIMFK